MLPRHDKIHDGLRQGRSHVSEQKDHGRDPLAEFQAVGPKPAPAGHLPAVGIRTAHADRPHRAARQGRRLRQRRVAARRNPGAHQP